MISQILADLLDDVRNDPTPAPKGATLDSIEVEGRTFLLRTAAELKVGDRYYPLPFRPGNRTDLKMAACHAWTDDQLGHRGWSTFDQEMVDVATAQPELARELYALIPAPTNL